MYINWYSSLCILEQDQLMSILITELPPKEVWLELRRKTIGSSDAAVIMGANPWKSPLELYQDKKEGRTAFVTKPMLRGIELEPAARSLFNLRTGLNAIPCFVTNDEYPFAHASLDGYDADKKIAIEIKTVSNLDDTTVRSYHYPQLQHIMAILNLDWMFYVLYDGYDIIVLPVDRDFDYCSDLLYREQRFLENLNNNIEPESDVNYQIIDDEEFRLLEESYMNAKNALQSAQKTEKMLRDDLIKRCEGKNTKGRFLKIQSYPRRGKIDYESFLQSRDIPPESLEDFRGNDELCWKICLN